MSTGTAHDSHIEHSADASACLAIIKGPSLASEPGLGALTMPGFLREVTSRYAGREALALRTSDHVERWTYRDLWDRSIEIAKALIASGVGKDSRVGILMSNRPEWISAFFGVGLAGGVAVALSTFASPQELDYLLRASGVSIVLFERVVAHKDFAEMLCELEPALRVETDQPLLSTKYPFLRGVVAVDDVGPAQHGESWAQFCARGKDIPTALVDARAAQTAPADKAALFFSSGTTAYPKGILSAHRGIAIQCWRWVRMFGLKENVRSWSANSFMWSGNFALILGGTLAVGGAIVLQRIFDPEEALMLFARERVSWPYAWPHQWAQLESAPGWNTTDLSSFAYVDPSRPAAKHPTFKGTGWVDPLWSYGNTETFTISTAYASDAPPDIAAGTNGEALPGNTIRIVDPDTGEVLLRGVSGEIAVKGPTLMLGYLGIPLDETLDEEGFFHTGDGGYIDGHDRLHFQARLTELVKTGGANVSPVEVDRALWECPGVKISKTLGVPHETLGELLVSCVVAQPGHTLDEDGVRSYLKERLASYKVPRRILFFGEDELSFTGSSKVKSNDLKEIVVERLSDDKA